MFLSSRFLPFPSALTGSFLPQVGRRVFFGVIPLDEGESSLDPSSLMPVALELRVTLSFFLRDYFRRTPLLFKSFVWHSFEEKVHGVVLETTK